MTDGSVSPAWFSERSALIALALSSTILAALVVLPYLNYILLAGVVAYVLVPVQRSLERYARPTTAAVGLTVVAVFAIFVPIAYVAAVAVQEGMEFAAAIQEGEFGLEALEGRLAAVGVAIELEAVYATYREPIATGLEGVAAGTFEIVGGLPEVFIGLTVTVFVLFSLLRDGEAFLAWLVRLAPFRDEVARELAAELDRLLWASIVGNVLVAGVQAALLGIGLALLGVPGLVFLTVATFVFALLPLVGAFAVWFPVAVYLFVMGRPVAGALLFGYGLLVSVADNYLRPALIGHRGKLDAAIVIVGIFGGVAMFGFVGLFVGPVVLGSAKVVLDVFAAA